MKQKLFFFAFLLALCFSSQAYDFSYTYQGKTLFYDISVTHIVSVVNPTGNTYYSYVGGNVVIPDSVENNGIKYAVKTIEYRAFEGCNGLTSITIPNTVTLIEGRAFFGCSELTSVEIPSTVTSIGSSAFYNCNNLISLTIPNSLTIINNEVFHGCSSLTSVVIPSSVTSINEGAFGGCRGLTSVFIPSSVSSIGPHPFGGCTGLVSIIVDSNNTHYDSRNNCNAIIQTDLNILIQGCKTTVIPNSVFVIGVSAFSGCHGLTTITIPDSVTNIGSYAFSGCSDLVSITIGKSMTDIGFEAFQSCNNLRKVYCKATTPPTLGSYGFDYISNTKIFVPCGFASVYRAATNWESNPIYETPFLDYEYNFYANDIYAHVNVENVNCDSNITVWVFDSLALCYGHNFIGWSDGVTGNPRTIHLTSDTTIVALFDRPTYSVVGQSNDTLYGTVTGSIDSAHCRDTVTLTAIPKSGYHFDHWHHNYGDCRVYDRSDNAYVWWWDDSVANPITIIVDTFDVLFTAYFEPNRYNICVHSADITKGGVGFYDGNNWWTNDSCHTLFYGDSIFIYANPDTINGFYFSHWSDGETNEFRRITITNDTTLYAFFGSIEDTNYRVTALSNDSTKGTVSGGGIYPQNTTVTISATPALGYRFENWSDGDTNNPRTLIPTSDTTITAIFGQNFYFVVGQCMDSTFGTVTGSTVAFRGDTVRLTAIPEPGYSFDHWSDGDTNNPKIINVTGNAIYNAYFSEKWYSITINYDTSLCRIEGNLQDTTYLGTRCFTVVPFTDRRIYWNDDYRDSLSRCITLTSDTVLTVYFEGAVHQVSVLAYSHGIVGCNRNNVSHGDTTYIWAIPDTGFHFELWSDGDTNAHRNITVTRDTTLTAFFDTNWYTLTVLSGDSTLGHVTGSGYYKHGSFVTATATPDSNSRFVRWSNDITSNPYSFYLTNDLQLTAIFEPVQSGNIHDTVHVYVHDTIRIIDTVIVNYYQYDTTLVNVFDTVINNHYQYDTTFVTINDTVINNIYQYDTSLVNVFDTTLYNVYQYDTTIVNIYDSVIYNNIYQYDTVVTNIYQYDTTLVNVFDTVINNVYQFDTTIVNVYDTTFFNTIYQYDTTIVNMYRYDTTLIYDTVINNVYQYDTSVVNIYDTAYYYNVFQYDTTYVFDTVTVNYYQYDTTLFNRYTFDTSIYNSFRYDTTLVFDTMIVNIYNYDTSIYNNYQFDTVILNYYQYDTTLITINDTVINNYYQFDTTFVNNIINNYDTVIVNYYLYDTTIVYVYDSTVNNHYQYDTVIVNNFVFDTVFVNNQYYDTVYNIYHDTVNNYYYDTVVLTRYYHDTVIVNNYIYDTIYLYQWLHDTIYIHDTVYITQEGIGDVEMLNAKIYQRDGQVVVEGAEQNAVTIYDAVGRSLAVKRDDYGNGIRFDIPASGVYLVKVGNAPARKVVVIR